MVQLEHLAMFRRQALEDVADVERENELVEGFVPAGASRSSTEIVSVEREDLRRSRSTPARLPSVKTKARTVPRPGSKRLLERQRRRNVSCTSSSASPRSPRRRPSPQIRRP
jgi:hypothetical protein